MHINMGNHNYNTFVIKLLINLAFDKEGIMERKRERQLEREIDFLFGWFLNILVNY